MALKALDQRMASSSKPATPVGGTPSSVPLAAGSSSSGSASALGGGDAAEDEVVKGDKEKE